MIDKWVTRLEWGVVCLTFPLASLLTFLQVVIRWLSKFQGEFVNQYTFGIMQWGPELTSYIMITGTLFGASMGAASHTHIGIDVITKKMPPLVRLAIELIMLLLVVSFLLYITYYSFRYIESERAAGILPDHLPGKMWMYHAPFAVALLMMVYRFAQQVPMKVREVRAGDKGEHGHHANVVAQERGGEPR